MIDKNGKLFGKINVIDFLIILVILAALIFVGVRLLDKDEINDPENTDVELTFFVGNGPAVLEGGCKPGEPAYDYDYKCNLGTVVSYETAPSYEYVYDSETKEAVLIPVNYAREVTCVCKTQGTMTANGLYIDGKLFVIGGTYVVCAGCARFECRLADIKVLD